MELIKAYLNKNTISFRTGFTPTPEQRQFLDLKAKKKIADVDRQWGKSRLIIEHALELLFRKKNSVIIVPHNATMRYYLHMFEDILSKTDFVVSVIGGGEIRYRGHSIKLLLAKENALRGSAPYLDRASCIFVDEFDMMSTYDLQYIKHFAKQNLIMLGTTSNNLEGAFYDDFIIYERS